MKRLLLPILLTSVIAAGCGQKTPPPATDTHGLAAEVHHKPELARKIISDVIAEPHGVVLIAEELSKHEMAAESVVDELMKHPAIAAAIADRCEAAKIAGQVGADDSSSAKKR